ncbi:MAG: eukaryotic-like serine/threonine-protein kinase [Acidimicrobiaceae bacterium]|nr:eukaryotic-like serine/threonine-protein kinase [Acidimicrobiaceae bacterium]
METTLTDRVLGGRYELGPLLGRGGMADVYDAVDARLGRPVAVKVLRPAMTVRADVRRRFEDEARAAAKLAHPNVVAVYDTGEDDGVPWIVMERLSGESLASRLVPGRPLETEWVLRMAGDVLGALTVAHAAGVVHRDVKPGNILFSDEGCAKVADFGIAKSVEAVGDATTAGLLLGTPRYLAPERFDGATSSASSDIYAMGVILYEALSGRRAFEGDTPVSVAFAVQHNEPTPLAELRPDLPADVVAVVDKAMARDPAARFTTAREMAAAVAQASGVVLGVDDTTATAIGADGAASAGADATVAVARDAWVAGSADPTAIAGAGALAGASAQPASAARAPGPNRRRNLDPRAVLVLAVGAAVVLLLAALAFADRSPGGSTAANASGGSDLSQGLRAAADRLATGDGPRGVEASNRLKAIADKLDQGQDASSDANSLLADSAAWNRDRQLGTRAFQTIKDALAKVPGVDVNAAQAAPPPTPAPAPVATPIQVGKGHGKHKKEHDD